MTTITPVDISFFGTRRRILCGPTCGPILEEYRDLADRYYIKYWVDCDADQDTSIFFAVDQSALDAFLEQSISMLEMMQRSTRYWYIEESRRTDLSYLYEIAAYSEIPDDYRPSPSVYFDPTSSIGMTVRVVSS